MIIHKEVVQFQLSDSEHVTCCCLIILQDFDKLVDMACKGNRNNIDTTLGELLPPQSAKDNVYISMAIPDIPIHLLGDAVIKSRGECTFYSLYTDVGLV